MATGPALRKLASHRSIHDGSFAEARDLTEVTFRLFQENRMDDCVKAADALVDHWETRVIAHADAEEDDDGLYQEIAKENPELQPKIYELTRDHDLLRIVVGEIKDSLKESRKITEDIMNKFQSLLVINRIHSRSEESLLEE
ncbi:hemerythrin domain-containing protein [Oceanobacillus halotolerans]|uniref:hemerythrin domain-containing protein n=1 Tax=Oceanobacillus halotolerans TaxID=2663380 RepID=UPI0013DAEC38|nr:hemerythrin domain-containing protein [Oceanobacillus halotolerans]